MKRALRDGSLNGKKHSPVEIDALVASGVFWKRYRVYVDRITFSAETIEENLDAWARDYPLRVDSKTGDTLGTRATDHAVANARPHQCHRAGFYVGCLRVYIPTGMAQREAYIGA